MAKGNKPQVGILAEDNDLVSFCLKIVMKLGIQTIRKKINIEVVPPEGAGFTFVHRQYPKLVKRHRARATKTSVLFVIGIDSDKKTFAGRSNELDGKLESNDLPKRDDAEPIVLVIPKRNIETWVEYFTRAVETRESVDEETDYKRRHKKPDIETAANGFVAEYRQWKSDAASVKTLNALIQTYKELNRVVG